MLADYHVHTNFSDDCEYPMQQVVEDAIARGLDEICFTDHVDYGVKQDPDDITQPVAFLFGDPTKPLLNVDYPAYFAEIDRLRRVYAGRITLRQGMEFGVQTQTADAFRALYKKYDYDCILLSIHEIDNKEFWNQEFQEGKTQKEYNDAYFASMLEVISQYKDYSVIAHMDVMRRYDAQGFYSYKNNLETIEAILRRLIADGKGLEVNTATTRYGIEDMTPAAGILQLYRALGGELLTIGSDSHKPTDLGCDIAPTQARLRELGFRAFYTYERMQPIGHLL